MSDAPPPTPPAGWYRDPAGFGDGRYWDGSRWSDTITRGGVTMSSTIDPGRATLPPVPGTEYREPPPRTTPPLTDTTNARMGTVPGPPPRRSAVGIVVTAVGVLVAAALVIALVVAISDSGSDDDPVDTSVPTETPPPTEAPAPTEAPPTDESGG